MRNSTRTVAAEIGENVAIQALPGEISTLDPPYMLSTEDTALGFNVYETLTRWDPDQGAVVPVLATAWTSNEAGTEWTFTLRQDVTFHDGTPLTAHDVKASLDRNVEIGMVAYGFVPRWLSAGETRGIHGANERVSIANLERGTLTLVAILEELAAPTSP